MMNICCCSHNAVGPPLVICSLSHCFPPENMTASLHSTAQHTPIQTALALSTIHTLLQSKTKEKKKEQKTDGCVLSSRSRLQWKEEPNLNRQVDTCIHTCLLLVVVSGDLQGCKDKIRAEADRHQDAGSVWKKNNNKKPLRICDKWSWISYIEQTLRSPDSGCLWLLSTSFTRFQTQSHMKYSCNAVGLKFKSKWSKLLQQSQR